VADTPTMEAGADPRQPDQRGFTLIELMVVALIIAILLAIAIPVFLGARQTANDRATQGNVRNAFSALRIYYNERFRYTDDPTEMVDVEPSLTWTTTPLADGSGERTIYLATFDTPATAQTVVVVGRTRQGRCFYLKDVMGGSGSGTFYDRKVAGGAACPVPDPDDPGWSSNWRSS
jgi:type IV pilus assembly protein PilA